MPNRATSTRIITAAVAGGALAAALGLGPDWSAGATPPESNTVPVQTGPEDPSGERP
ncbi:hypothetical protein [Nocardia bhagyanarayanae]|uniref:Uncharacterized protein n=1 Tax=Nocardia bhagyanarayanae TaxID=1215925 RepID=A0A543EXU4_9NOCA|nr:hypothetical protein [Nocardia bhagyanarayanae]TQM26395.1 hypothetical protein FB390_6587 [Nocardia bhagyanarayanae]